MLLLSLLSAYFNPLCISAMIDQNHQHQQFSTSSSEADVTNVSIHVIHSYGHNQNYVQHQELSLQSST